MIKFSCPNCGNNIRISAEHAGRTGKCKSCGTPVTVPNVREASESDHEGVASENTPAITPLNSPSLETIQVIPPYPPLRERGQDATTFVSLEVGMLESRRSDTLGIASIVVGVLSFLSCCIPFVNLWLGTLGVALGVAGLISAYRRGGEAMGFSIAGIGVSIIAFLAGLPVLFPLAGIPLGLMSPPSKIAKERSSEDLNALALGGEFKQDKASSQVLSRDSSGETKGEKSSSGDEGIAKTIAKFSRPGEPSSIGDVSVAITKVMVGNVAAKNALDNTSAKSKEKYLQVLIKITNNNDHRKIDYRSWLESTRGFGVLAFKLMDEYGNTYKPIAPSAFHEYDYASGNQTLYPHKEIRDMLMFELPVDNANHFFLTLDASSCGVDGDFRLSFDRAILQKHDSNAQSVLTVDSCWKSDTYHCRIQKVAPGLWQEFRDSDNQVVWNYKEIDAKPECVELFLIEREQRMRISDKVMEIFENGQWRWVASGYWKAK